MGTATDGGTARRGYAIATLAFLAAWAALTFPWLSGRLTVPWDAKAHFQAQLQFLADSIHRGEWPWWNPYVFSGSPQVADPQSLIFSLPHLALAALDPQPGFRAADALSFGMLGFGGIALIGLFRDRAWHPAGAVVAALAFAFGGSAAWRIQHTGQIMSLAWFAIALFVWLRALDRSSAGWAALAGVAAGCMVIGRDQVAWLGVLLLVFFTVWTVLAAPRPMAALARALRPLAAGFATGLLVAGLPIAMTFMLAGDSQRPAIDFVGAGRGSLHPAGLLSAFAANLYGTDGPLAEFWGQPSVIWGPTDLFLARNMSNVYAGGLVTMAMLAAFPVLWSREVRPFTAAAILTLLYALGWYTPAFTLFWHVLLGIDLWRRPADATFLLGALLAILAGYAVHRIASGTLCWTRPAMIVLGLLAGAAYAACLGVAAWKGQLAHAAPAILVGLAFAALSGLLLLWLARRRRPLALAVLAVAVLLATDLAIGNGPNESTALPPALFDVLRPDSADPTIAELRRRLGAESAPDRRDRVELAGIDFHWPNASMVHRLDNTLGYNPLRLASYARATGAEDTVALPEQRRFSALMPGYHSLMADLLGLRWIVTRGPASDIDKALEDGDLVEVARTAQARIYENPRALPRATVPGDALATDFETLLREGRWPDGFNPRQQVLLDPADGAVPAGPHRPAGTARIVRYANSEVVVEADSPEGGWVVLADSWHPWWYADVDGQAMPVRRADAILRAVEIGPGRHQVRFVFRPLTGLRDEIAERLRRRPAAAGRPD